MFIDKLKLPSIDLADNLDTPERALWHGKIIQQKIFLRNLYIDFYRQFQTAIKGRPVDGCFVELGSGGGFIKEIIPNVITSDILPIPTVDKHFSVLQMPFPCISVDAFLMINVFHHIPNPSLFLQEAQRCLKKGGKIVMIEPANTFFSRFIYQNFHHEPFDPQGEWSFPSQGPLSSANGALPWIIFYRDRKRFIQEFPNLKIIGLFPHTPFRYLLSGGLSYKQLVPAGSFQLFTIFEKLLSPLFTFCGMFLTIELEKINDS